MDWKRNMGYHLKNTLLGFYGGGREVDYIQKRD
jgi:hypothetical protein